MQTTLQGFKEKEAVKPTKIRFDIPVLDSFTNVTQGIVVIRSKNKNFLHYLLAKSIVNNFDPQRNVSYMHAGQAQGIDFLLHFATNLGLDPSSYLKNINYLEQPGEYVSFYQQNFQFALLEFNTHEHKKIEKMLRVTADKSCPGFIFDSSTKPCKELEDFASVIIDISNEPGGIKFDLLKHPSLSERTYSIPFLQYF